MGEHKMISPKLLSSEAVWAQFLRPDVLRVSTAREFGPGLGLALSFLLQMQGREVCGSRPHSLLMAFT